MTECAFLLFTQWRSKGGGGRWGRWGRSNPGGTFWGGGGKIDVILKNKNREDVKKGRQKNEGGAKNF